MTHLFPTRRSSYLVKACDEAGVMTYVPHPRAVNTRGDFVDKSRFAYDTGSDSYRCPGGRQLRFRNVSGKDRARNYRAAADCTDCPLKRHCTNAKRRWVTRHEHEPVLDALASRMRSRPDPMNLRRCRAAHPFAILHAMMCAAPLPSPGP